MIGDELDRLRRANPVAEKDVAHIVAAHRSALIETIGKGHATVATAAAFSAPAAPQPSAERATGFRLAGVAAAVLMVVAIPMVLLAGSPGTSNDSELPVLDQLPVPADPDSADDSFDGEDELFSPVPSETRDAVVISAPTATTLPTTPSTTVEADTDSHALPQAEPDTVQPDTEQSAPTTSAAPEDVPAQAPVTAIPNPATPDPAAASPVDEAQPTTPPSTTPAIASAPTTTPPTTTPTTTAPPTTIPTVTPVALGDATQPFDPEVDLLVIGLDFAGRDDGHAAVAALEIATSRGLDPMVVAHTQSVDSGRPAQPYRDVMSAAWGSDWLDAATDRAAVVERAADRWLETIDVGGVIRVAEGGVSDFSAEVVRELLRRRPTLDTESVVEVVHHNTRNVNRTQDDDLELVQSRTTFVRIEDGNVANDSADLNGASSEFESAALSGPHGDAWAVAFDYWPVASLDFSDTVTVLDILGVGLDEVADADDFAAMFID